MGIQGEGRMGEIEVKRCTLHEHSSCPVFWGEREGQLWQVLASVQVSLAAGVLPIASQRTWEGRTGVCCSVAELTGIQLVASEPADTQTHLGMTFLKYIK